MAKTKNFWSKFFFWSESIQNGPKRILKRNSRFRKKFPLRLDIAIFSKNEGHKSKSGQSQGNCPQRCFNTKFCLSGELSTDMLRYKILFKLGELSTDMLLLIIRRHISNYPLEPKDLTRLQRRCRFLFQIKLSFIWSPFRYFFLLWGGATSKFVFVPNLTLPT